MANNSEKGNGDLKQQMRNLLEKLESTDELETSQKQKLASSIKRIYEMLKQKLLVNGSFFDRKELNSYIKKIIDNYEKVKDLKSINMLMQQIAEDYQEYLQDESVEKKVLLIHKTILGNPGTNIDGMTNEYIEDIIRLKLTDKDGINRDDVINLMMMQYKNMYDNIEEYQSLINSCVIDNFTYSRNGEIFKNPKILHIIERLASSYKVSEQFDKVEEIYKLAEGMSHLKGTPEYIELMKQYEEFKKFMRSRENANEIKFDSDKKISNGIKKIVAGQKLFIKGHRSKNKKHKGSTNPVYIMPEEKREEAIDVILKKLQKINPDYNITEGVEYSYDQSDLAFYIQFKIDGTNVSILENFVEDNPRFFIVKNECIDKIAPMSKWDALKVEGVIGRNHIQDFDKFCDNVVDSICELIQETSPKKKEVKYKKQNTNPQASILNGFIGGLTDSSESDEKNSDEELQTNATDSEKENDLSIPEDTESSTAEETNTKTDEEPKDLDPVEAERRKAHEQQEYLRKLKARIAENLEEIEAIKKEVEDLGKK